MIFYTHLPLNECLSRLIDPEASGPHGARVINNPDYCRWNGGSRIETSVTGSKIKVDLIGAQHKNYAIATFRGIIYKDSTSSGTIIQGKLPVSLSAIVAGVLVILFAVFPFAMHMLADHSPGQPPRPIKPETFLIWYGMSVPMSLMMIYTFTSSRSLIKNFVMELLEAREPVASPQM